MMTACPSIEDRSVPKITLFLIRQNLCNPRQSLDFDYVITEIDQFNYTGLVLCADSRKLFAVQ
jgi:hypothetical protein